MPHIIFLASGRGQPCITRRQSRSSGGRVMQKATPHRGFTLVELLVTMAIIGIIAVFAYPSYESYMVRNNRGAAQAVLLDVAQRQQQYLLDNRSYATWAQITAAGVTVPSNVSQFYNFDTTPL